MPDQPGSAWNRTITIDTALGGRGCGEREAGDLVVGSAHWWSDGVIRLDDSSSTMNTYVTSPHGDF